MVWWHPAFPSEHFTFEADAEEMVIMRTLAGDAWHNVCFGSKARVSVVVHGVGFEFAIVDSYKHIGAMLNPRRSMKPEAAHRVASMQEHFRGSRARLYAWKSLDMHAKLVFARAFAYSRLLYCAGTWDSLRDAELATVRSAYMAVLRAAADMVNRPGVERRTDAQVLVHTSALPIEAKIAVARFTTLARLVRFGPPSSIRVTLTWHMGLNGAG